MRMLNTEAIVLRRINYGEADRILTLLTREGKKSAIAKGVRKPKSKLAGGIEIFSVIDLTLVEGKGDMFVVSSSRIKEFFKNILAEYERMELAYAAIKEINKVTETVSEPEFYSLLKNTFKFLNNLGIDWRLSELYFRLSLKSLLGSGLNLKTDINNQPLKIETKYNFDFETSCFAPSDHGKFVADHIKFLRLANQKTPNILGQVSGLETIIDDCLWLARN